jgi:hypothetical protein
MEIILSEITFSAQNEVHQNAHQEGLRDGAAVDAVVDPDSVARVQLVEQLLQSLHVI